MRNDVIYARLGYVTLVNLPPSCLLLYCAIHHSPHQFMVGQHGPGTAASRAGTRS